MECLPESLRGRRFYLPSDAGYEKTIRQFLEHREALRRRGPRRAEPPREG